MNVAFPALVIFLVILPGFIFRQSFRLSEKTVIDQTPFATASVKGLVYSALLHLPWVLISSAFGHSVDYYALLMLLVSPQREGSLLTVVEQTAASFNWVLLYFITLYLAAAMLGIFARYVVVTMKWDRHETLREFVKFDTPWYYLFKGYNEAFEVDGVVVSAVVEIDKNPFVYTGLLKEYFFAPDGTLDRLVIEMAMRRPLSKDRKLEEVDSELERFYPITGDYFVLRYAEIKTLNIEFLRVEASEVVAAADATG